MTEEDKKAMMAQAMDVLRGATIHQLNMFVESGAKVVYQESGAPSASPHFPLNGREEEGRQWFQFLVSRGFIASDSDLGSWLYLMGFSASQPELLRRVAWMKTVETARLMLCRVHGRLKLPFTKMKELAAQCFTKQGQPLSLAKPRKECSLDADAIETFVPTVSDF